MSRENKIIRNEMDTLDESLLETTNLTKQRHGCVTAWLVLLIFTNSLVALLYLLGGDNISKRLPGGISNNILILLAILGILNVGCSVMLFQWKKLGFWGFVLTSICAFVINLNVGLGIGQSIFGLVGIAVLYGVLQIKKDNHSAWTNLE
jgi:hypothetical protein